MIRTMIIALACAAPFSAAAMTCGEYSRYVDGGITAFDAMTPEGIAEFATRAGVVQGVVVGVEAARPDLVGMSGDLDAYCQDNPSADPFEFIKGKLQG